MTERALQEFLASIAPYRKLWGALRASGTAVHLGGIWFNLAIRLEFVEDSPTKAERHSPEPIFLYYVMDFPMNEAERVIRELVLGGHFDLTTGASDAGRFAQILMKREPENAGGALSQPVQWSTPIRREAGVPGDPSGRKRTSITLSGYGQYVTDLFSFEVARKIEARLRRAKPCYDGLTGLFAHILPGVSYTGRDNTFLEVTAELPFELRQTERDALTLDAAALTPHDALSLRCFYGPGTGLPPSVIVLEPRDAEKLEDRRLRWTIRPTWPEGTESAKVILFFEEEQVQTLQVKRWPGAGDLRQIVDGYFDPAQEWLKDTLSNRRGELNPQEFEWAVVRLLNLLGLPAIWYGKGAAPAKPDLAGYLEGGTVLLAECTLEKPLEKFSGLAERTKQLQSQIRLETDVLPIVFTRAETVDSEKQQAQEHSLVLVGQSELQELLKMFASGAGTQESLAYLERLRSNVNLELGAMLHGRWAPRW